MFIPALIAKLQANPTTAKTTSFIILLKAFGSHANLVVFRKMARQFRKLRHPLRGADGILKHNHSQFQFLSASGAY